MKIYKLVVYSRPDYHLNFSYGCEDDIIPSHEFFKETKEEIDQVEKDILSEKILKLEARPLEYIIDVINVSGEYIRNEDDGDLVEMEIENGERKIIEDDKDVNDDEDDEDVSCSYRED